MADFYNNLVTQKSWETLTQLKKKIKFVLIGGWAVYLYTKALKSKDIDIVVEYDQLDKLRKSFAVSKNERLKKYEARREEVQVDVYLPHFSDLGIPAGEVVKNVKSRETFMVPVLELLLILKQLAYSERKLSVKGQKDKMDIMGMLFFASVDFAKYEKFLSQFNKKFLKKELKDLVKSMVKIPELGINEHQWSRKKKDNFRRAMNKLVLIDGHAILHRAYHALPPMTNKDGLQTNAVYGFVTMLMQILDNLKPTNLAVAFDLPQPTFRMQQYTAYQAKRPDMQGNLVEQIPLIHELLDALKIPYFEVPGYEADDILGTLSRDPAVGRGDVMIVTGDRDMLQLVNEKVKVCVPLKGFSETKIYDEKLIEEEFGVKPEQWVDVKALKGDASDNYPGVRGIGPKTAQNLIAKFGTLDEVYKNLGKLEPKTAKKLAEGAEEAGMGKKLAQIVTDVPVHLDLEKAGLQNINWSEGTKCMREKLGFKTLVEKVEKKYLKKDEPHSAEAPRGKQLGLI